jgi:hypothetical protein
MKTNFSLTFLFIFAIFIIADSVQSQTDDNGVPYFPLRVGNAFYYRYYHCNPGGCDSAFVISRITKTKTFNGRRYYYVSNIFGRTNSNAYVRYNSSSGCLVYLDTTNTACKYEMALYNLAANVGDSVSSTCRYGNNFKCKSIVDSSVFDNVLRVKKFGFYATSYGWVIEAGTHFARQRGCIYDFSATFNNSFAAYQRFMQGCKISNIVYGDTIDHITPAYADSGRYMPLAIGNKWVYMYHHDPPTTSMKISVTITRDTIAYNKRYFLVKNIFRDSTWVRYDAYTGKLLQYTTYTCNNEHEYMLYDLKAKNGDTASSIPCSFSNDICGGVKDTNFLGLQTKFKFFGRYWSNGHYYSYSNCNFAQGLGMYFSNAGAGGNAFEYHDLTLLGCYINGVLYGDTTTVTPPSYADSSRYFPMKIGNKFYYKRNYTYHRSSPDSTAYDSSYYIVKITDTTRLHGKLYYKMNSFIAGTHNYFRHDLDSGYLIAYDSISWCTAIPYELKCFMLISNAGQDGTGTCWLNNFYSRCYQIHDTSAFGSQRKVKGYFTMWGGTSGGHYYTLLLKDIGLCQYEAYSYSYAFGYSATTKYRLIGAFVDGVKYGDTNTVGIKSISNEIPSEYKLYQNYPNPFNPSTNIRYQIPILSSPHALSGDLVLLKVYDILGKEVATLVNEKQSPGVYEVTFDGSQYPSGIYFYKLVAGDFSEVKRMILIK